MQPFPSLPAVADAPDLFERGHLWTQELLVGAPLRFRLEPSGSVTVADAERTLDDPAPSLQAAVRHVRERLDRAALLEAADDPSEVVCYGVATRFEGVPYDWARLPPFVGTDVWSASRGEYLPPDVVERTFERLNLTPANALDKEVDARYFDPDGYDFPESAWYDGPVAGVVFRNKTGGRAVRRNPDVGAGDGGEPDSWPRDPEAVVERVVTDGRVRRARDQLRSEGRVADVDGVMARVTELVAREEHGRLPDGFGDRAYRSAMAERVQELLG